MTTGDTFNSNGVRIVFDDRSPGGVSDPAPVCLLHGFASSRTNNWREQGWYDELLDAGRRVVAMDVRGHGDSEKSHDADAYDLPTMARDVVGLLNHLDVERVDFLGYSMGARIGAHLLVDNGDRFNSAVLAGVGGHVLADVGAGDAIADGLRADDASDVTHPVARRFRRFAESNDNDLDALAACIHALEQVPGRDVLATVDTPVLVVAGEDDMIAGDADDFADAFGDGEAVTVPDADHVEAVLHPRFKEAVGEFLDRRGIE